MKTMTTMEAERPKGQTRVPVRWFEAQPIAINIKPVQRESRNGVLRQIATYSLRGYTRIVESNFGGKGKA